jgi:hypothetical protein
MANSGVVKAIPGSLLALMPSLWWLAAGACAAEPAAPPDPAIEFRQALERVLDDDSGQLARLAEQLLGKNGGDRLFYFPTLDQPFTPARYGFRFEDAEFPSADGTKLHGWFVPVTKGKAKGTVVFSHGNAGSVAHHFGFVSWLPAAGYHVFLYDYRGYGKSAGKVARKGMIEDVAAAFAHVASRKEVDPGILLSLGHSLGGAKSVAALAGQRPRGLRGVATIGAFASYRTVAQAWAGKTGASLVTDEFAPKDLVAKLAPVPVLVIHGEADEVVPFAEGETLAAAAHEPKQFWKVPGGRHNDLLERDGGAWRKKLLDWLDARSVAR